MSTFCLESFCVCVKNTRAILPVVRRSLNHLNILGINGSDDRVRLEPHLDPVRQLGHRDALVQVLPDHVGEQSSLRHDEFPLLEACLLPLIVEVEHRLDGVCFPDVRPYHGEPDRIHELLFEDEARHDAQQKREDHLEKHHPEILQVLKEGFLLGIVAFVGSFSTPSHAIPRSKRFFQYSL